MNYTKLPKKVLLLLATPVMLSLAVPASKLVAQSQTETKIRLMAEALRARDSGDLATAKTNLEQLLVLAPNDPTVQRLLAGVNEVIANGSGTAQSAAPAVVASDSLPVVVYDPNKPVAPAVEAGASTGTPAGEPVAAAEPVAPSPDQLSAELARAEENRVKELLAGAKSQSKAASKMAKDGDFDGASAKLSAAAASLPTNTLTQGTLEDLAKQKNDLLLQKSQYLLEQGDTKGAKESLDAYIAATSPEGRAVKKQSALIEESEFRPPLQPIEKINPEFVKEQKDIAALAAKGRSQYAAGAYDEAQETFRMVETVSADSAEAKYFLKRIAEEKARIGVLNREKTRSQLLEEVAKAWQRPGVFIERSGEDIRQDKIGNPLIKKLESIILPSVSFNGAELSQVISTLSALSEEYDPATTGTKGVNLVLSSPLAGANIPKVNITLRGLSLKRILDIVTENADYEYVIDNDLVQIRPSGGTANLITEQFPINKATLTRMTGLGASSASTPTATASADPFAPAPVTSPSTGGGATGGESDAIRRFLQAAGVGFDGVPSASLAYDGAAIIVTQTPRNIEKIRNILARYNDIRQVEIEAKFLDVREGTLDEMGVSWNTLAFEENGNTFGFVAGRSGALRSLGGAFTNTSTGGQGQIVIPSDGINDGQTIPINNSPPSPPGTVDLAGAVLPLGSFTGLIGDVSVDAQLRALSRRNGSDMLSAPKVTVMSGSRATITVAQELRYPQSYGEIQSDVGTSGGGGGLTGGGSAGVTITAGTPSDFTTRNVGVELSVTPTVEEDDYSISLELNPRVTEFEGYVEYGGTSVAVSQGTTVTVPSGFYQPVFSSREINTRVTVWDGATLVMGGLTREEVRRVNDKVPVLGDIPFIGRAFQSKGEASEKRNLLVFVTANLVSPGGSLKKQRLKGVEPSSLFQNPTVVTPGGSESRVRVTTEQ
jgi:general secretion pathway protein D